MAMAMDIVRGPSSSRPCAYAVDALMFGHSRPAPESQEDMCFFEPAAAAPQQHCLLGPGSPNLAAERCHHSQHFHHSQRMEADVRLLSGSKRSCEGFTSLQDEAEADDASMASGMLCRSSSVKSGGIKRVCSVASADAIDSHCPAHLLQQQQQQQFSIMIPVPGSCGNLSAADTLAASSAPAAAKRSSKTGSSSVSSQEHGGSPAAAAMLGALPSPQESASFGASGSGRKLAPIRTSVAPKAPRMRLGGRLLSPEEAQKHLQAVAAAAAAASAGRSLSRAQSPALTCCAGGRATTTSSPAGLNNSSMSLSLSAGAAPCSSSGGHSSGGPAPVHCQQKPAPGFFLPQQQQGIVKLSAPPAAAAGLDALPENFIPTPEGMGNWLTLASTVDGPNSGATSRGRSSPLVGNTTTTTTSYTELLMAEEGAPAGAAAMLAAGRGGMGGVSAFAAPSAEPWPLQQQQQRTAPMPLPSAGSFSSPHPGGLVTLGSSCPVHIPMQQRAHSGWARSKLLQGSLSGSNGSSNTHNSLAASLAAQGSAPGPVSTLAAQDSNAATELSELLDSWAPPQQQQDKRPAPVMAKFNSSSSGAATWKHAFTPAAASSFSPAASTAAPTAAAGGSGMAPNLGLSAVGSTPTLTALPQQQQLQRSKSSSSRTKRQSKQAASKSAKPAPQLALPQQEQQQMLVVADGGQRVVLSQQELMAVLQQNMAASFASGYMMASSMQTGGGQQQQPAQQPPLLKPVASIGAFNMPQSAMAAPGAASPGRGLDTTAAAAAALGSSTDIPRLGMGHGVDDILPSLQELLTDCY